MLQPLCEFENYMLDVAYNLIRGKEVIDFPFLGKCQQSAMELRVACLTLSFLLTCQSVLVCSLLCFRRLQMPANHQHCWTMRCVSVPMCACALIPHNTLKHLPLQFVMAVNGCEIRLGID